jgi:peptidoglycan/xylan/chitin deacetylase (PgdA/CDA1 family)
VNASAASSRVTTLCFHGIGTPGRPTENGEERFWITEERFGEIMGVVADHPEVEVTFDDANASDHSAALPVLLAHGRHAEFFMIVDRLDRPGSLSRAQVRDLHTAGMGIGSHGMDHVPWQSLVDESQRRREFVQAAEVLEELVGTPVRHAACPRGSYDRRVLGSLRSLGYERVYTVDGGTSRPGSWVRDRYSVTVHDDAASIAAYLRDPDGGPRAAAERRLRGLVKRWR